VLDNIALIPQYRANLTYDKAADQAWAHRGGSPPCDASNGFPRSQAFTRRIVS
jgi:hypothetical protein